MIEKFTIRVYGLLIHKNRLLISSEVYEGKQILKFPGGGLEFGESVVECLQREFKEELGVGVTAHELFHISEDFIQSVFRPEEQVVLVYYIIDVDEYKFTTTEHKVKWIDFDENPDFTFKIEQDVFEKLKQSGYS